MSLASISERLEALQETTQSLSQLIQRLTRLQPTSDDHLANEEARQDLTGDIHDSLKQAEEDLEVVNQDVSDLAGITSHKKASAHRRASERDKDTAEASATCLRLGEELKKARVRFRKAQLQAKRNCELYDRKERAAYLANLQAAAASSGAARAQDDQAKEPLSYASATAALFAGRRGPRRDPNATQDDQVLTATNDVTSSLRRTHALLTSELSRSRFAQETLEQSNAALEELNDRYTGLDDLLTKSKGLIGTLLRSNKSDTWYLETTLKILIATVVWLVFRRLFYGPMWWFLYLPLKLTWKMVSFVFGGASALVGRPVKTSQLASGPTSLKVMPSATGRPPSIPEHVRGRAAHVPVGAGGAGAKSSNDRDVPDAAAESLSEYLGSVAKGENTTSALEAQATAPADANEQEANKRGSNEVAEEKNEEEEVKVRRGDGQPLRERDEAKEPRNPKKRMFEEPPPEQQPRDEL
ncbi:MAG: hypothetical protein M1828_005411 [Chrysothrix sp. TS-e1954]|nr:MAG: hypothetical protein M1828_005411 [Chrysothrix sp. TS-e1954]